MDRLLRAQIIRELRTMANAITAIIVIMEKYDEQYYVTGEELMNMLPHVRTIKTEKVTRPELRSFAVGESREYELPSPQACQSAAVSASQMKIEDIDFTCDQKRKMEGIIVIKRIS